MQKKKKDNAIFSVANKILFKGKITRGLIILINKIIHWNIFHS